VINHIILSNSGKYIFLHKAYEAITHEFLAHFIPQHIFDNVHCYEKQYLAAPGVCGTVIIYLHARAL
jgi:hypothetical protein